jgi:hypothetical protein
MAKVSARTANWRLFGGGGLILGGILWTLNEILVLAGVAALGPWLALVALIIVAVGLVLVAFGETGSNGAVGNWVLGKVALLVYAAAFVLIAINLAFPLGDTVVAIAAVLLIVGGLGSAYAILAKGVAKGAARWVLFVPAVVGALWALGLSLVPALAFSWLALVLALLIAVTGALYLFNDRNVG